MKSPNPQIICFSETSPTKSDPTSNISINTIKLERQSPVVTLDTISASGDDVHGPSASELLAVHGDGTVTCYSQDLGSEEWSTQDSLNQQSAPISRVEDAVVVSLHEAWQTILKSREDISASLSNGREEADVSLLLLTTRSSPNEGRGGYGTLSLQILYIDSWNMKARKLSVGTVRNAKELISLSIPEPQEFSSPSSEFFFHIASGTMYQSAGGKLAIYDFTGSIPRLAHKLDLAQDIRTSYLRLSSNLLLCSNEDHLYVVDLPYCSLQAQIELKELHKAKKREDEDTIKADFKLVSFHAPSDLAIALDGRKLLAIQLPATTSHSAGARKKRKRDGLLVNAIGRGSTFMTNPPSGPIVSAGNVKSLGTYIPQSTAHDSWSHQTSELHRYRSLNDADGFEKTAASLLGIAINEREKRNRKPTNHPRLDRQKVHCVLSGMFSVTKPEHEVGSEAGDARNGLQVRLLPRKLCDALIEHGVFNASHIETSLKHTGALSKNSKLAPSAFMQALAEWDISLGLLSSFLTSTILLSSAELVHILAVVTRDSNATRSTEDPKLLMNGGGEGEYDDVQMLLTNGETTHKSSSPSPELASSDHSQRILILTMKRLYVIPPASVARALRSALSTTQLRILVDTLRMEIARSGWLSPYEERLEALDPEHHDNNKICYIAHLLSCAIDSIGTGGWILGTSNTDELVETSDTLSYMKAEISAVLEGIEEATYLKGMLGEMLLCGKETLRSPVKVSKPNETHRMALSAKPVTIALEEVSNALPLGLKPAQVLSFSKVGTGGELMKRSARDIGRQKSKMVGKYSFERIAI